LADMPCQPPSPGKVPGAGFRPTSPQSAAGSRMEPPPSEAVATLTIPAATAAAEPLLEPPAVRERSHGLRAGPNGHSASSGIVVVPTITAPVARSAAVSGPSATAGCSALAVPSAPGTPSTGWDSLTSTGRPSRGSEEPAPRALSAARASADASPARSRRTACSCGSSWLMRSRTSARSASAVVPPSRSTAS